MILNLGNGPADAVHVSGDEVVRFDDASGTRNHIDCHIDCDIRKVGENFYVNVTVTGDFSTACHRCLESTRCRVDASFQLIVQRAGSATESDAAGDEDLVHLPADTDELSLDPYIYENLMVNIPIRIVCDEECKGLCSGCGVNLNHESCRCEATADPRWDALRRLGDSWRER